MIYSKLGTYWRYRNVINGAAKGIRYLRNDYALDKPEGFDANPSTSRFFSSEEAPRNKSHLFPTWKAISVCDEATPKSILLVGSPGMGKVLHEKATAEGLHLLSTSGSDFTAGEILCDNGPIRVRRLFQEARQCAPCIIFIDEIDAIWQAPSTGSGSEWFSDLSSYVREGTLKQLLKEMALLKKTSNVVVVMASTTTPNTLLDSALLGPGGFDRIMTTEKLDAKGREQIFRMCLQRIKEADGFNSWRLAALTDGFDGDDICDVCHEAALIAGEAEFTMEHFDEAVGRIREKKAI